MGLIQLKRTKRSGDALTTVKNNTILAFGEPFYDATNKLLFIGDGVNRISDLPYIGENEVFNAQTHYDFPSIGRVNTIYKAESEKMVYQWNATELKYEALNTIESDVPLDITLIDCGNAASY